MRVRPLLGTGVDYSIFMQSALRRHDGDLRMAYRSVGRALLLCGGTAITGFGTLALSSNAGMASLGQVCAVGIAANMLIGIFLLPAWWCKLQSRAAKQNERALDENPDSQPSTIRREEGLTTPSSLYRSEIWRFGLWLVRSLPQSACEMLGKILASCYWVVAAHRRKVVFENLLPACRQNKPAASRATRKLFRQFAVKVADLWRFEAGLPIDHLAHPAHQRALGVLGLDLHGAVDRREARRGDARCWRQRRRSIVGTSVVEVAAEGWLARHRRSVPVVLVGRLQ